MIPSRSSPRPSDVSRPRAKGGSGPRCLGRVPEECSDRKKIKIEEIFQNSLNKEGFDYVKIIRIQKIQ